MNESITVESERVLLAIRSGSGRFQGLTAEETAGIVTILEEKLAEDSARRVAQPHYPSRIAGRVQTSVASDPRAKAIFEARLRRRRIEPDGPIRYLGFSTTENCRIFRFGRLPPRNEDDLFEIRIAHGFFGPGQLSLQEGPGYCTGVLTEKNFPAQYEVTADDVQEFAAKRPGKAGKR